MAAPVLGNHSASEIFRSIFLDFIDASVTGTGAITLDLSLPAGVGTLAYAGGSSGNLVLTDLGNGAYRLVGTAAELTASLMNLGFQPAVGFVETFLLELAASNPEGTAAGSKRLSFDLAGGDTLALGNGGNSFLFTSLAGGPQATVDAGAGVDTLVIEGTSTLVIALAMTDQQVTTGSVNATYTGFENIDARGALGALTVTLAANTARVETGAAVDDITFRNVAAFVDAGAGADVLRLDPAALSDPALSTALTINLALVDANQITVGASAGSTWRNFEHLSAAAWDRNLTVSAFGAGSVIATGSGNDTVTLGAGVDSIDTGAGNDRVNGVTGTDDVVELGSGNDTATWSASANGTTNGGDDVDQLTYSGGAATIDLTADPHFSEFENLSAGSATGAINFVGAAGTTSVTTGTGNDVIDVAFASAGVTINAGDCWRRVKTEPLFGVVPTEN